MDFIDLRAQYAELGSDIESAVLAVLRSGRYILGPEGERLERNLASLVDVPHVVACSSGTDALVLALMAEGVRPGDVVITSPFTFYATAEAINLVGATPAFVDIDADTFNIDPALVAAAAESAASRGRLVGAIGVDMFGLPAEYDRIRAALPSECFLIEDAAQSLGASTKDGAAGALASVGCTSFFPSKPLGGYGDGGAVFVRDADAAALMRSLRMHGQGTHRYEHVRVGMNGRLDEIQAAILNVKLSAFREEIERRQKIAQWYLESLTAYQIPVQAPSVPLGATSAWAQFSVRAKDEGARTVLIERLTEKGIPTAIHYPIPLHRQPVYASLGYGLGSFPVAEAVCGQVFSLPMHPYLSQETVTSIVQAMA